MIWVVYYTAVWLRVIFLRDLQNLTESIANFHSLVVYYNTRHDDKKKEKEKRKRKVEYNHVQDFFPHIILWTQRTRIYSQLSLSLSHSHSHGQSNKYRLDKRSVIFSIIQRV